MCRGKNFFVRGRGGRNNILWILLQKATFFEVGQGGFVI
jgi:hypothetical protein